jgi:hypothetical protein
MNITAELHDKTVIFAQVVMLRTGDNLLKPLPEL